MRKKIHQLLSLALLAAFLGACPAPENATNATSLATENTTHGSLGRWLFPFAVSDNLWSAVADNFELTPDEAPAPVAAQIRRYRKHPHEFITIAHNARPYLYYVFQQTQQRNMPAEIALLPIVESHYDAFVYSKRGATGLWQMMPSTASGFGLQIDWWYDGRRDLITATHAALNYLAYLHRRFGDWLLAIAAYDSGEGTVRSAIAYNKRHHHPTNFWSLHLPHETRTYVPKLLALATIIRDPDAYHVRLPALPNQPYFENIPMKGQIDLARIAAIAGTKVSTVRRLNPGFRRWTTRPKKSYALLLPTNVIQRFQNNLNDNHEQRVTWLHYRVGAGDSLSRIAFHHRTTVDILRRVNKLKNDRIHVHQALLVPLTKKLTHFGPSHHYSASVSEDHVPGPKRHLHVVKPHESLWSIALHYGVQPHQIRYWNHLRYHSTLKPGKKLTLWLSHKHKGHHR